MVCGRHGCGHHGLWPPWLWPSWFVAIMVCGRHGCGHHGLWPPWYGPVVVHGCLLTNVLQSQDELCVSDAAAADSNDDCVVLTRITSLIC